ncbi:hypothetical protein D3C73_650930 [compost metagenome]
MPKYAVFYKETLMTEPASKIQAEMQLLQLRYMFKNLEVKPYTQINAANLKEYYGINNIVVLTGRL